jgi:hypothetical protein
MLAREVRLGKRPLGCSEGALFFFFMHGMWLLCIVLVTA